MQALPDSAPMPATTNIQALFGFVMLALVVGLELNQPPPTLLNPDPHALN